MKQLVREKEENYHNYLTRKIGDFGGYTWNCQIICNG